MKMELLVLVILRFDGKIEERNKGGIMMKYCQKNNEVEIICRDDFDLVKIFECGQCFRWNMDEKGVYTGVALGKAARIRMENDRIYISGTVEDFEKIWYRYFDFGRNYAEIRSKLQVDDYMKDASAYGAGIRILNQDRWEGLCSFIISQCNNIPRIKKIVETLCRCFGDETELDGEKFYTFPSAAKIAKLQVEDLAPLRCGYRAPYIIDAAKAVASGEVDLDRLAEGSVENAISVLKKMNGIGDKVANCVVLFSLQMLSAFPIDVWMKKAIDEHYGKGFDVKIFGEYAGIAQQYMFYYQRERDKSAKD